LRDFNSTHRHWLLVALLAAGAGCSGDSVEYLGSEDDLLGSAEEALTIHIRPDGTRIQFPGAEKRNITYCISNAFNTISDGVTMGVKAKVRDGFADATNDWMDAADVRFIYVPSQDSNCVGSNPNIVMPVIPSFDRPTGNGHGENYDEGSVVYLGCRTPDDQCQIPQVQDRTAIYQLMIHEVGHALGFAHEFANPGSATTTPSPLLPECTDYGAHESLTNYDSESAMHYIVGNGCAGTATLTHMTDLDRKGAQLVYGIPWETLGSAIVGKPAISSWGVGRLDVFARRASDNVLVANYYDGTWHAWNPLPGITLSSSPAAVSWGANRIDLVARGSDNKIWHLWFGAGQWQPWEPLNGLTAASGTPAISSWGVNRLDIFARGTDNALKHLSFTQSGWGTWTSRGTPPGVALASGLAAVSWGTNRIDVVARGADNQVWDLWYNGAWQPWAPLGAPAYNVGADPAIDSQGPGLLDIYVLNKPNTQPGSLYRLSHTANGWGQFEWLGGFHTYGSGYGVSAVSWQAGRIDLVGFRSENTEVQHAWFANGVWR